MNRVIIMGNLGGDPELRYTQSGTAVLNLRVATTERRKQGEEWTDHTEWHNVIVWGKRAEGLAKHVEKGSKLLVEGRLRTTDWEKDGVRRWKTEIVADDVHFAGGGRGGGQQRAAGPSGYQGPPAGGGFDDDDIPF